MKIEIIESTDSPEELVCTAARNDYRSDGVIGYSFNDLVDNASVDTDLIQEVAEEYGHSSPENIESYRIHKLPPKIIKEVKKRTLINHLMRSGHWGPFEHPQATISIEGVTRVSMAQITRHRHFTFDIMSMRYVEIDTHDPDETIKKPHNLTDDNVKTKKGIKEPDISPERREEIWYNTVQKQLEAYRELVHGGYPKEEARKLLGMGTKVNIVMSGNARAWMHLLNIRGKSNVQGEARRVADGVMGEMKEWMPYTFDRYDEEVLPLQLNP